MSCPREQLFLDLVEGELVDAERQMLHSHASSCEACRRLMAALARSTWPGVPRHGQQVAHYRVEEILGRGSMGIVHRAFDLKLRRPVAIKFLSPRLADDLQARARLEREARACATLDHPNVGGVYEIGEHEESVFLVMPLLDGGTLKDRLSQGPMPVDTAIAILRQLAAGLGAAHGAGILHRDIKPSNVLLSSNGVRLVDFGLAKLNSASATLSVSGQLVGTPSYMAPEQFEGAGDERADLWSIGAVAYEMLAGHPPFVGDSLTALYTAVRTREPAPIGRADMPADLETVIRNCLERDPERRYRSAMALADDLARCADERPIAARPPSAAYRAGRFLGHHRAGVVVTIVGALALVAGGVALRERSSARERANRAQALGQSVQKMRSLMRNAYMMPLHDTTREREQVRAEMRDVEAAMQQLGDSAAGPGHFGLGTGWQVLDDARALPELEAAWAGGEHGPDVAYALALALGQTYQVELRRLRPGPEAEIKKRALKERYADRALSLLRTAGSARDTSPAYIEALIDWYDNRLPDALTAAERAFDEQPSQYEAGKLAAVVEGMRTQELWKAGDEPGARASFEHVRRLLQRTLEIARSDDLLYRAFADQLSSRASQVPKEAPALQHEALVACEHARTARPDAVPTLVLEATIYATGAFIELNAGRDPREALHKSLELGELALTKDPREWRAMLAVGDAYGALGDWEAAHGIDPRTSYEKSAAQYRLCVTFVADGDALANLAVTLSNLGEWQLAHEMDPRAALEEARQVARDGLSAVAQADPRGIMASATAWLAVDAVHRGADAAPLITEALREGRAASRGSANSPDGAFAVSAALLAQAEAERQRGGDPQKVLVSAAEENEDVLRRFADSGTLRDETARLWVTDAEWRSEHGLDPRAPIARAQTQLDRSLATDPDDVLALMLRARIEHVLSRGRGPAAAARARAAAEKVLAHDPALPAARRMLAALSAE